MPGAMPRQRVAAALDAGTAHGLSVVVGGPGWGKTSAVSAWARQRTNRLAWMTADDGAPEAFWSAVASAIVATGLPPGHPLTGLTAIERMDPALSTALHQGIASLPGPTVLVLDDFQAVTDTVILQGLATLLDLGLPLHLVLVGRVDPVPPLPLHRLRVDGRLSEITSDGLAFDADEIVRLGALHGVALGPDDAQRILERTDGWPAGVRLALLHLLDDGSPRDLSEFAGSSRTVADYLAAEMLDNQPRAARDMLLRTSVVRSVSADLAAWISGDTAAARHLDALERAHLFVTSHGTEDRWYRYHPLLRQLLHYRLARDDPRGLRTAHRRAATWYLKHRRTVEALRHAAWAQDWGLVSRIVVRDTAPHLFDRDRTAVAAVLAALPVAELAPTAALEVCAGALTVLRGEPTAVGHHVTRARRLLAATPEPDRPAVSAGTEYLDLAHARASGDHTRMVAICSGALAAVDAADALADDPTLGAYRAAFLNNRGVGLLWSGRVDDARASLVAARSSATATGMELTAVNAVSHLALCSALSGRGAEADRLAVEALGEADRLGATARAQTRGAHLAAAIAALLRYDPDTAVRSSAVCTEGVSEIFPEPWLTSAALLVASMAELDRRRPRAALRALAAAEALLRTHRPAPLVDALHVHAVTDLALVDVSDRTAHPRGGPELGPAAASSPVALACRARRGLAAHDDDAAERAARRVLAVASRNDPSDDPSDDPWDDPSDDPQSTVEALLVLAVVADRRRQDHEALTHLRRAVAMAATRDVWRPFIALGSPGGPGERIGTLLHRLADLAPGGLDVPQPVLDRLFGGRDPSPEPLSEPLTQRELSVLMFLPTLQSNEEIARELFVSVNTVKTHLRGLYRKLGVNSRRAAATRAAALGLLRADGTLTRDG